MAIIVDVVTFAGNHGMYCASKLIYMYHLACFAKFLDVSEIFQDIARAQTKPKEGPWPWLS